MVDGDWIVEPDLVKQEFRRHFTDRFQDPGSRRGSLNFPFPNRLNNDQILELESPISNEDIRTAVWGCGVDKSPGLDDVQTAFLLNRQILDGPFIINEILARCKLKKQQAMIFKVDFAKAYDFVRWDYLDDVLIYFGFGPK
ncbi:hypothetical protein Tco_1084390 [Tanacetum coccineum]